MAKKIRPSLKDYLRTGVVRFNDEGEQGTDAEGAALPASPPTDDHSPSAALLALLSERDRLTWEPILGAGTEIRTAPLDFTKLKDEFHSADKNRFTYYLLADGEEHLRPVRTSAQIQSPLALLLKWDETGILTCYGLQLRTSMIPTSR